MRVAPLVSHAIPLSVNNWNDCFHCCFINAAGKLLTGFTPSRTHFKFKSESEHFGFLSKAKSWPHSGEKKNKS